MRVSASRMGSVEEQKQPARALCVARHEYIADHLSRFFAALGNDTRPAVGLEDGLRVSRGFEPDVVIAEYELLATLSLDAWERDALLARTAVVAVSLTHRPSEAHLLDVNGIAGFLYLPVLDTETATRLIRAAAASSRSRYVPAPATTFPLLVRNP